ncbi:MAG: T9SS type A sorting domain-containing protein [Bacteroidota bacterium]
MYRLITVILFVILGLSGYSSIRQVPSQYSTIQSAINAAVNGDTVLVAPGVYYENIQFRGKGITVASLYLTTSDTSYIDATVINGGQPAHADTASCVIMRGTSLASSTDSTAALIGFRLTGGTGTRWEDEHGPGSWYREGGAILIQYLSPRILFNHITLNQATGLQNCVSAGGGAIRCGDGNPKICNNVIDHNQGRYGAGLVFNFSGAIIKNNIIANNSGGEDFGGGGIWAYGSDGLSRPRIVENNTIVNNAGTTVGGGIRAWSASMTIRNSILWGNTAATGPQINYSTVAPVVRYCDIQGGYQGTAILNVAPLFESMNYSLSPVSPCIDKGDSTLVYNDPEDPSNPGMALAPAKGTTRNDLGAYGGSGSARLAGIQTVYTGVSEHFPGPGISLTLFPNPCTDLLSISFVQLKAGHLTVILYAMDGRVARIIADQETPAGKQQLSIPVAGLGSGMYMVKVETEGMRESRVFVKR